MSYYNDCFEHITDPVQRNSVRQQWLQMLNGGLSVADVRMLLLATLERNPTTLMSSIMFGF
ncbi:hypothetical protein MICAC_610005 [Microcystis aeruginosa PCC 9443]|jgi:hypothetical protein|uniref:Uncharacterized protein n=1 Tax=Microcystis aeruginosa PCC 9443 TaxID=1160281 RepID=I4GAC9_MICAE|nr:hypothetical protein MICAC_610005 [Microcystis aeruginosa PCC 9443]